ncbi:hypothetical protein [Pantoea sp. AS142]|uniref:hypothetical protein n=1 Tax=Pantoea sp. AS142 TaxID=3081292 RepID=UPI00301800D2
MNIKQISEIKNFYTHFLAHIKFVEMSYGTHLKSEDEMKRELREWLNEHKEARTFGDNVRHEIFHMLNLVASESVEQLVKKIAIFEKNCESIHLEMESEEFMRRNIFNLKINSLY